MGKHAKSPLCVLFFLQANRGRMEKKRTFAADYLGQTGFDSGPESLNGGEDYELLFTVPLTDHERVLQIPDVKVIGHITRAELGQKLVTKDGSEFDLKAQGWNPLREGEGA